MKPILFTGLGAFTLGLALSALLFDPQTHHAQEQTQRALAGGEQALAAARDWKQNYQIAMTVAKKWESVAVRWEKLYCNTDEGKFNADCKEKP